MAIYSDLTCAHIVSVSYVFSKAIWTTSSFSRSVIRFSYFEFTTKKLFHRFSTIFLKWISMDFFILSLPWQMHSYLFLQQRSRKPFWIKGEIFQEKNKNIIIYLMHLKGQCHKIRLENRCHFWLGIGGLIWLLCTYVLYSIIYAI